MEMFLEIPDVVKTNIVTDNEIADIKGWRKNIIYELY